MSTILLQASFSWKTNKRKPWASLLLSHHAVLLLSDPSTPLNLTALERWKSSVRERACVFAGAFQNCSIIPPLVNVQWSETGTQHNENEETQIQRENIDTFVSVCLRCRVCVDASEKGENNIEVWIQCFRDPVYADMSIIFLTAGINNKINNTWSTLHRVIMCPQLCTFSFSLGELRL